MAEPVGFLLSGSKFLGFLSDLSSGVSVGTGENPPGFPRGCGRVFESTSPAVSTEFVKRNVSEIVRVNELRTIGPGYVPENHRALLRQNGAVKPMDALLPLFVSQGGWIILLGILLAAFFLWLAFRRS